MELHKSPVLYNKASIPLKTKMAYAFVTLTFISCYFSVKAYSQTNYHVQKVLAEIAVSQPSKVKYLLETRKWYLVYPNVKSVGPEIELKLQKAFLLDFQQLFKGYGNRYLIPWEVLAAKSGRETFWGTSFLCASSNNYFGIRAKSKPWLCESFNYCDTIMRNDPEPAAFAVFPNFEASLWMFIHTIFSPHFLARLPDKGQRVAGALNYERQFRTHYWLAKLSVRIYAHQLTEKIYGVDDILKTWSGYTKNNLCINCDITSDKNWIQKVYTANDPNRHTND